MPALSLIPLAEIVAALEHVEQVTLRGTVYVEHDAVVHALLPLLRWDDAAFSPHPATDGAVLPAVTLRPPPGPAAVPSEAESPTPRSDDPLEQERARLAALPPGPCVGCKEIHPDGPTARCDDYVDRTVRDPIQARIERGETGPGGAIAPLYQPEPEFNPGARAALRTAPPAETFGNMPDGPEYDPTPQGPVL